jgi:hypothetical protein
MARRKSRVDRAALQAQVRLLRQHYTARELSEAFHLSPSTEGKTLRRWATGERLPGPKNRDRIHRLARRLEQTSGWYQDPAGSTADAEAEVALVRQMLQEYLRQPEARRDKASALIRWILDAMEEEAGSARAGWQWREYIGRQPDPRLVRFMQEARFALVGFFAFSDSLGILTTLAAASSLLDLRALERCFGGLLTSGSSGRPNLHRGKLRTLLEDIHHELQRRVALLERKHSA